MNNTQFLQALQIEQWKVRQPGRLEGVSFAPISLPYYCRILLLCPQRPTPSECTFLAKVLSSFNVSLEEAFFLEPQNVVEIDVSNLEWAWFCECAPIDLKGVKTLHSEALSLVESNKDYKQALWKQIKSYE